MTGLTMAAQLILGLSILVILHEFGHFIAARAFNIKVEKFYLFFDAWGFKLFSFKKGDTEYGIGWLPLGGYVKIAGMVDESMDKEQMAKPPQPWEFRSKPAWQRLIVMIGGVTMNVILAVVIFWLMTFKYGETYLPNSEVKHGIVAYELAQKIGLRTGDQVVSINGQKIEKFDELLSSKVYFGNSTITVSRNGQLIDIHVPADFIEQLSQKGKDQFIDKRFSFFVGEVLPKSNAEKAGLIKGDVIIGVDTTKIEFFDQLQQTFKAKSGKPVVLSINRQGKVLELMANIDKNGKIGFAPDSKDFNFKTINYGFFESFPVGVKRAGQILSDNVKGLGKIFRGEVSASNSVEGPIGIARIYGGSFDWVRFWSMTGLLSMGLAIMNMLPIPALDGGHVLFLSVEAVTRRKMSDKMMERAQIVGMALLLSLMVFILGNDIWKHFLR